MEPIKQVGSDRDKSISVARHLLVFAVHLRWPMSFGIDVLKDGMSYRSYLLVIGPIGFALSWIIKDWLSQSKG